MLNILHHVDSILPDLIAEPGVWKSKYINYKPPITERMYRDWTHNGITYRIYLHRIHPCDRAFFHPHPWPSAIRVLNVPGSVYEMGTGFSSAERHEPPPHGAVLRCTGGFEYEMTHPDGWHYVKIIGEPSVSVMVSGPVWDRSAPRTEKYDFRPLTDAETSVIMEHINRSRNATSK